MKFPEEYVKKGKFVLHSGEITDTFYDVNTMLTNNNEMCKIVEFIISPYKLGDETLYIGKPPFDTYVGIATGGAIIASQFRPYNWAMIKDGELKGEVRGNFCLIDDVVTTENSIRDAINIIGRKPKKTFVVVDRRKNKTMEIESMHQV